MLKNILCKLAIATAGSALSFAAIEVKAVQSSTVEYNFFVNVNSGVLINNDYRGYFRYDDSTLIGSGFESVGANQGLKLNLEFLGKRYSDLNQFQDKNIPLTLNLPRLYFFDGSLLGLIYFVIDGQVDPQDPGKCIDSCLVFGIEYTNFEYLRDNARGETEDRGVGSVIYSRFITPRSVPEPRNAIGLGLLGLSWLLKKEITRPGIR